MHGMAVVALDRLAPFAHRSLDRGAREAVRRRHLLPDHEAEPVGPVEVARVLDLLVLANAVEAHRLGELDVLPEGLVARRRHERVGPVALVEHHAQQVGPAVEHEAIAQDRDRAQRGVRGELVDHGVAGEQAHRRVEQRRPLRAPQQLVAEVVDARIGEDDEAIGLVVDHLVAVAREQRACRGKASPRSTRSSTASPATRASKRSA